MVNRTLPLALAALLLTISPARAGDPAPESKDVPADVAKLEQDIVKVVRRISPAFVVIGGGSGVLISPDGFMLTNHHVAGSRSIGDDWRIKLPNGKIYSAEMIGTDPYGDISLLKVRAKDKSFKFPFVPLGDSDKTAVGDWVIALGNPFGFAKDSTPTVTLGLISAKNRMQGNYGDAIQTDAAINSGNSGGPLLDTRGRLIGINGSITTRHGVKINSGAGYAISINQIKRFMKALKAGGVVKHGTIAGLTVTNSRRGGDGAVVSKVDDGSTAAEAGFQRGDRITAIAGLDVNCRERCLGVLSTFPSGTELEVSFVRDGETQTVKVKTSDDPRASGSVLDRFRRFRRGRGRGNRDRDNGDRDKKDKDQDKKDDSDD